MAADGFGAFVAPQSPQDRRTSLELMRRIGLYVPIAGGTMTGNLIVPKIYAGGTSGDAIYIGDDSKLVDVNVANTLGVQGQGAPTQGFIKFGSAGPTIGYAGSGNLLLPTTVQLGAGGPTINTNGDYIHLDSDTDVYVDGNAIYLRNAAGSDYGYLNNTELALYGTRAFYFPTYGGGWFMSDATWIRASGNKNIYTSGEIRGGKFSFEGTGYVLNNSGDTDTGIYYDSDGVYRLIANGFTSAYVTPNVLTVPGNAGAIMRLYEKSDGNHELKWSAATPTGSGEASNGPMLSGYSSVWLYNVVANKSAYLASTGNFFISSGNTYTNFSSREFKDNIVSLDPEDCLDSVRRWRPVEFDYKDDELGNAPGRRHADGFIAEEMALVTPSIVATRGPKEERPGWAYGIGYSETTPRLAGAVQALLARVETLQTQNAALERRLNALERRP